MKYRKAANSLGIFTKGLLNFLSHYCNNQHDTPWCKFHAATNEDDSPYTTKSPCFALYSQKHLRSCSKVCQTNLRNISLLLVR